jgi:glycosyltransferase involved in cell wall biosynthesis
MAVEAAAAPMKVLLVTQEFPPDVIGGVGYHAYHLASALADQGHDVHVLTGTSDRHTPDDSLPPLADVAVSTIEYRRRPAPRLWFARAARRWPNDWDRLSAFDVVHAHEYLAFDRLAFDGTTVQKIHFNLTEKAAYLSLDGVPRPLERAAFELAGATLWRAERRLEREAIVGADVTVANSRLTRSICVDRHGVDPAAIEVVYNGVDGDQFAPGGDPAAEDSLLFVGGDSERKGFGQLLAAVQQLDEKFADFGVRDGFDLVGVVFLDTVIDELAEVGRVSRQRVLGKITFDFQVPKVIVDCAIQMHDVALLGMWGVK